MMKKIVGLFLVMALASGTALAQKYGHLNFGSVVSLMPETKSANSTLETYREGLIAKGEAMAQQFQTQYGKFVADVQSGELSPVEQQKRQEALEKKQNEIITYEQVVQQQVETKRAELLQPIIQKVEKAVADVAQANGYVMVFDTSVFNAILFADQTDDLLPLVKTELDID